jgi:hypothetical protein
MSLAGRSAFKHSTPQNRTFRFRPFPALHDWGFVVYDSLARSMLEATQKTAGIDSNKKVSRRTPSVTIWFAPEAPVGHKDNWVQTLPGTKLERTSAPLQAGAALVRQGIEAGRF